MQKDILTFILRPIVTEKITKQTETQQKYAFEVHPDLNKIEIKKGIEDRFKVKVKSVRTMNYLGKLKVHSRMAGRRKSWKKAIVTLQKGFEIELYEGV